VYFQGTDADQKGAVLSVSSDGGTPDVVVSLEDTKDLAVVFDDNNIFYLKDDGRSTSIERFEIDEARHTTFLTGFKQVENFAAGPTHLCAVVADQGFELLCRKK